MAGLPAIGLPQRAKTGVRRMRDFAHLLVVDFLRDGGLQNAASLTYTTLLSLVPLMTVSLAVLSAFPISSRVGELLQDFVFSNFVPTSGEVLQGYLQQFSVKASKLTGAGFIFLIIVALMMMGTIDRAFNTIWHAQNKRSFLGVFLVYWAVLTLGPMLIGVSVALTSYLVSIPLFSDAASSFGFGRRVLGLLPLAASIVAFTLLYALVPNRNVPLRHALAGGVLAALLFELAKRGFALYIAYFPTYEAIYGAMAVIPIFLIWIYLSWLVTLLGAEFTYCLGIFKDSLHGGRDGAGAQLLLAFRILERLWRAQREGNALALKQLQAAAPGSADEEVESLLHVLHKERLVIRTNENTWVLARDMAAVKLSELHRAGDFVVPRPEQLTGLSRQPDRALAGVLRQADEEIAKTMNVPLAELFAQGSSDQSLNVKILKNPQRVDEP